MVDGTFAIPKSSSFHNFITGHRGGLLPGLSADARSDAGGQTNGVEDASKFVDPLAVVCSFHSSGQRWMGSSSTNSITKYGQPSSVIPADRVAWQCSSGPTRRVSGIPGGTGRSPSAEPAGGE